MIMITRSVDDDNDNQVDDIVNNDFPNLSEKTKNNLIIVHKIRKYILNNNSEIRALINERRKYAQR